MPGFFAPSVSRLIEELSKLPGIGPKTGQRLAMHLVDRPQEQVLALAEALTQLKEQVGYCSICSNLTDSDPCEICQDDSRDRKTVCVVEDPSDVVAMERTRQFKGLYHVLHGLISPMDGVGPEQLRIQPLLDRLKEESIQEVILATDPTVEGEATAMYLGRIIRPLGVEVTRIARGLPEGGNLDYADEATLVRALEGRQRIDVNSEKDS